MTRRWLAALALAAVGVGGVALMQRARPPEQRRAEVAQKPALVLLTSLPLVFGERFSIEGGGSPTLTRLESEYRLVHVAVADSTSLAGQQLFLMAHPRAQPAAVLVELDAWVRRGGRLLLLADPRLDWPSSRPLGDALRPPPDFADTGLLAHWGLRLDGPTVEGPQSERVGGYEVMTVSPGRLTSAGQKCVVVSDGLIGHCRIGRGAATVIADADFLNVGGKGAIDGPTSGNLDMLMAELSRLRSR